MSARDTAGGYTGRLLRLLLASSVSLLLLSTAAGSAGATSTTSERVTVYYFHSTPRCETCLFIKALAELTLRAEFPEEPASSTLVWRPLDLHLPGNNHFVADFILRANNLVVVREKAGEV